jgi:LmbE family N-acetylglucosaminyl deacetylase
VVTPFARGRLLRLAEHAPRLGAEAVLGRPGGVLAVIPHPDDESLAMGRLLAAARRAGRSLGVLLVTDGGASHRTSRLPRDRLARLRLRELREALRHLGGVDAFAALAHPDGAAPGEPDAGDLRAAEVVARVVGAGVVLTCWGRDPHVDHAATAAMAATLARHLGLPAPVEAPVWGRFTEAEPGPGRRLVRLRDEAHGAVKARAVAAHRSQMTPLVPGDPEGFVMAPETRAHFLEAPELFLLPEGAA